MKVKKWGVKPPFLFLNEENDILSILSGKKV